MKNGKIKEKIKYELTKLPDKIENFKNDVNLEN